MRSFLSYLAWAALVGAALTGCGPDPEILERSMLIYDTQVAEVTTSTALFSWRTSVPGTSRVDLALLTVEATDTVDIESVSDELYIPLHLGGGVRVPDPRFEYVSDTRVKFGPLRNEHRVLADRLLPGRTYVATVSSNSGLGAQAWEYGITLTFTTSPAPLEVARGQAGSGDTDGADTDEADMDAGGSGGG